VTKRQPQVEYEVAINAGEIPMVIGISFHPPVIENLFTLMKIF
jgi:hypothetical protein